MKEEIVREWGKIHPLGSFVLATTNQSTITHPPTPENLIYQFPPTSLLRENHFLTSLPDAFVEASESTVPEPSQALALHYGHPRFIEYPEEEVIVPTARRPLFPLALAIICGFVVWYIYYVTGRQLQLQQEVFNHQESIVQEQQVRAGLTAAQVKVLSFTDPGRSAVTAKLFWDTKKQTCRMYLDQLPQAAEGEVFHLWYFNREAQFRRVTTFQAVNGTAEILLRFTPETLQQSERVVVSLEPPSDSPFPVGAILLRGTLH